MEQKKLLVACAVVACMGQWNAVAQELPERIPSSSMWLIAPPANATAVQYRYDGEGIPYRISWGMDVAWNWNTNVRRGTYHCGKENLSYGRISFQPNDLVTESGELTSAQQSTLRSRINNLKISGVTNVMLNCDHEALNDRGGFDNYLHKPEEWYKVIKASVKYINANGLNVVSIAPFNEPDYSGWNEGTKQDFKDIAKLIQEDPDLAGIRICAGNTLNPDYALEWYNYMKPYVQEGNTHQLAGSFNNYAKFFETVRADGNQATADELHNTMEAFVGVEYGLQNGIWWGFDGVARGRFCKATTGGSRLGYGENRGKWTAGCVYRLPDGSVDAFLGSSERQANTTEFAISSLDRDVFYDGYGPVRTYQMQIPGGTGYQVGQTNAERIIHITTGADVPLCPIADGEYLIVNRRSTRIMSTNNATGNGATVTQSTRHSNRTDETWKIEAVPPTVGGDFSYHYITNSAGSRLLDVKNSNLSEAGSIIAYAGGKGDIEQWHFIYAGDGDYYIQSRFSGLFLAVTNSSSVVTQRTLDTNNKYFRWRLMPVRSSVDLSAPDAPTELKATPHSSSVLLEWQPSTDQGVDSYIILRGDATTETGENWQTIGRGITGTQFLDNSCVAGKPYLYKVKAVDDAGNRSEDSELIPAQTLAERALVAHYSLDNSILDATDNQFDIVSDATPAYYTSSVKEGTASINLNSTQNGLHYLMLPPAATHQREITVAAWVRWRGGNSWQRIFDFGNGTEQYMFLTPMNGSSQLSLVLKNGGDEQVLSSTSSLSRSVWRHVAVTLSDTEVRIYVDGTVVASSEDITIRPTDFLPGLCYIGRSQFAADPCFYGYIDDVKIYNYALAPEEIKAVMEGLPTGVETMKAMQQPSSVVSTEFYTLGGQKVQVPHHGIFIMKEHRSDGTVTSRKVIR